MSTPVSVSILWPGPHKLGEIRAFGGPVYRCPELPFFHMFFKSSEIELIRLQLSQLQPHLRHTCWRLYSSHTDPIWGVGAPETLLLQECCGCPKAHTLQCRGRDQRHGAHIASGLPGGTSLEEPAGPRAGQQLACNFRTTQMVGGTKSSESDLCKPERHLLIYKRSTQASVHAHVSLADIPFLYTSHVGSQIIITMLGNINQSTRSLSYDWNV